MIVSEYMTPDPFVVGHHESVANLVDVLRRHRIHQVPVTDGSNRLVGIITDRDVRSAMGKEDPKKLKLKAKDIMITKVVTVTPTTRLEEALDILSRERFGALPVVVGDHVVGILSSRDLLRRFKELLQQMKAPDGDVGAREHEPHDQVREARYVHRPLTN